MTVRSCRGNGGDQRVAGGVSHESKSREGRIMNPFRITQPSVGLEFDRWLDVQPVVKLVGSRSCVGLIKLDLSRRQDELDGIVGGMSGDWDEQISRVKHEPPKVEPHQGCQDDV